VDECVPSFGQCHDPTFERDIGASQDIRVAVAIPAFVVRQRDLAREAQRPGAANREQFSANQRVTLHLLSLAGCQPGWRDEDAVGDANLADNMQRHGVLHMGDHVLRQPQRLRDPRA